MYIYTYIYKILISSLSLSLFLHLLLLIFFVGFISMRLILFSLLLLLWFSQLSLAQRLHQPTVKIDLIHHCYCDLRVGSPSTLEHFMVMRDLSEILLSSSLTHSINYHTSAVVFDDPLTNITHGSDLFQISSQSVRLNVLWLDSLNLATTKGIPMMGYSGIIGLGEGSPLWKYWRGFSIDAWSLILHSFSFSSSSSSSSPSTTTIITKQQQQHNGFEKLLCHWIPLTEQPKITIHTGHHNYDSLLWLKQQQAFSVFPYAVKSNSSMSLKLYGETVSDIRELVSVHDTYGAIAELVSFPINQSDVVMGFWGLRYFEQHVDIMNRTWCIQPARFFLVNSDNDCWFSVISSISIAILMGTWLLGSLSFFNPSDEGSVLILLLIKTYALMWSLLFIIIHLKCFPGPHLLKKFTGHHQHNNSDYYLLIILLLVGLILDVIFSFGSFIYLLHQRRQREQQQRQRQKQQQKRESIRYYYYLDFLLLLNKLLFEPVALLTIWISLLGDSVSSHHILRNIIIAVLLLTLTTVNLFISLVQRSVLLVPAAALFVLSLLFLVFFNVVVYEENYNTSYGSRRDALVSISLIILSLFMGLYIFTSYHDYWMHNMMNSLFSSFYSYSSSSFPKKI